MRLKDKHERQTGHAGAQTGKAAAALRASRTCGRGEAGDRTHSGRIHWESAESMFYRAIIRLVFGEGVKQTGPVRS